MNGGLSAAGLARCYERGRKRRRQILAERERERAKAARCVNRKSKIGNAEAQQPSTGDTHDET